MTPQDRTLKVIHYEIYKTIIENSLSLSETTVGSLPSERINSLCMESFENYTPTKGSSISNMANRVLSQLSTGSLEEIQNIIQHDHMVLSEMSVISTKLAECNMDLYKIMKTDLSLSVEHIRTMVENEIPKTSTPVEAFSVEMFDWGLLNNGNTLGIFMTLTSKYINVFNGTDVTPFHAERCLNSCLDLKIKNLSFSFEDIQLSTTLQNVLTKNYSNQLVLQRIKNNTDRSNNIPKAMAELTDLQVQLNDFVHNYSNHTLYGALEENISILQDQIALAFSGIYILKNTTYKDTIVFGDSPFVFSDEKINSSTFTANDIVTTVNYLTLVNKSPMPKNGWSDTFIASNHTKAMEWLQSDNEKAKKYKEDQDRRAYRRAVNLALTEWSKDFHRTNTLSNPVQSQIEEISQRSVIARESLTDMVSDFIITQMNDENISSFYKTLRSSYDTISNENLNSDTRKEAQARTFVKNSALILQKVA